MSKIRRIITTLAVSLGLLAPAAMPAIASAQIEDGLCQGSNLKLEEDGSTCVVDDVNETDRVNSIITDVINIISLVVGVIAVIMIIVGGLKYITSGGDSGNVTGAKNTILYAVVGLVVVALAQIIVRFVLNKATSAVD